MHLRVLRGPLPGILFALPLGELRIVASNHYGHFAADGCPGELFAELFKGSARCFLKALGKLDAYGSPAVAEHFESVPKQRAETVLREAERLPSEGQAAFAGHSLKGQALFGRGEFSAALGELLAARKIIHGDVNLLNLIGRSFLKIGDSRQAAQAFADSLALNKDQPEIEKLRDTASAPPEDKKK